MRGRSWGLSSVFLTAYPHGRVGRRVVMTNLTCR